MTPDPPSERRSTSSDFREIAHCYHTLDKRVAVMEARIDAQEQRLDDIDHKINVVAENVQAILDKLSIHILTDVEMHRRVLAWTVTTMVSASLALAGMVGKFLLFGK